MLDRKQLIELDEFIERHLVFKLSEAPYELSNISGEILQNDLEDFININRKPTFNQLLFSIIDNNGSTDPDIYKKAGLDRKHFSKIRSNPKYKPSKLTVIALALALELNVNETEQLLISAGFFLSDSDTFDLVIQFCIEKEIYDIHAVNEALEYYKLRTLGGGRE